MVRMLEVSIKGGFSLAMNEYNCGGEKEGGRWESVCVCVRERERERERETHLATQTINSSLEYLDQACAALLDSILLHRSGMENSL